ncbi:hypothetical protein Tco_1144334 [Tanacetum coccineum]
MDDNQLNEADLVVDAENLLIETEIQDVDDLTVDTDAEENLVTASEGCWACQIQKFKMDEGCEMVKVRDKRAAAYRTLNKKEGKEVVHERDNVAEYKKTGDVIEDIDAVEKPKKNQSRKCGHSGEKTNKHTKTTCPSNPKYVAKLARIVVLAEQGAITATATEQATRIVVVTEQATNAS